MEGRCHGGVGLSVVPANSAAWLSHGAVRQSEGVCPRELGKACGGRRALASGCTGGGQIFYLPKVNVDSGKVKDFPANKANISKEERKRREIENKSWDGGGDKALEVPVSLPSALAQLRIHFALLGDFPSF